jgi:hypothetical protein
LIFSVLSVLSVRAKKAMSPSLFIFNSVRNTHIGVPLLVSSEVEGDSGNIVGSGAGGGGVGAGAGAGLGAAGFLGAAAFFGAAFFAGFFLATFFAAFFAVFLAAFLTTFFLAAFLAAFFGFAFPFLAGFFFLAIARKFLDGCWFFVFVVLPFTRMKVI